jgi:hypothetical protein
MTWDYSTLLGMHEIVQMKPHPRAPYDRVELSDFCCFLVKTRTTQHQCTLDHLVLLSQSLLTGLLIYLPNTIFIITVGKSFRPQSWLFKPFRCFSAICLVLATRYPSVVVQPFFICSILRKAYPWSLSDMRKSVSVYEMKDFKVLDLFQPNDMWSYMDLPAFAGIAILGSSIDVHFESFNLK